MNRLVLIGNGFDLAHGLKTKYEDFFYWYWWNKTNEFVHNTSNISEDVLCKLTCRSSTSWLVSLDYDMDLKYGNGKKIYKHLISDNRNYNIEFSPFFDKIRKSIEDKGWVDIENEYYFFLRKRVSSLNKYYEVDIKKLNNQLDFLRDLLIFYLKKVEENQISIKDGIENKIYRPFKRKEVSVTYKGSDCEDEPPQKIMLLNFNYTHTPELYIKNHKEAEVIYIHGKLDEKESIIFGYGDEMDVNFENLKELNENECLRHVKTIHYLESDSYRKMLEFIESNYFQVCIMGHSCGISDRTLLNTLFKHRNCVSIKPYYYINGSGFNNFLDMVQNIYRNFTDMEMMRDKVVVKPYCEQLT